MSLLSTLFTRARRELALIAAALLLLAFGQLAAEVLEGETLAFDKAVLLALREPDNLAEPIGPAWFDEAARDITALGSFACLGLLLAAATGYLLLRRKRATATLLLVSVIGGTIVSTLLKFAFDRPRPDVVTPAARVFTASFPSGHATMSAITFLTIAALLARSKVEVPVKAYVVVLGVLLTLLVGLSRIYLGVHYPTDVLAGWCLGAAWAAMCWGIAARLQQRGAVEPPST
jgi:undecaprenyl-diphosphatase